MAVAVGTSLRALPPEAMTALKRSLAYPPSPAGVVQPAPDHRRRKLARHAVETGQQRRPGRPPEPARPPPPTAQTASPRARRTVAAGLQPAAQPVIRPRHAVPGVGEFHHRPGDNRLRVLPVERLVPLHRGEIPAFCNILPAGRKRGEDDVHGKPAPIPRTEPPPLRARWSRRPAAPSVRPQAHPPRAGTGPPSSSAGPRPPPGQRRARAWRGDCPGPGPQIAGKQGLGLQQTVPRSFLGLSSVRTRPARARAAAGSLRRLHTSGGFSSSQASIAHSEGGDRPVVRQWWRPFADRAQCAQHQALEQRVSLRFDIRGGCRG